MKIVYSVLLAVQAICLALFLFGDIGFDHPGRYGLDFSHFIGIVLVYATAAISCIVIAFRNRQWVLVGGPLLPIVAAAIVSFLPTPKHDPLKYQDLVGKSKKEVVRRIGHPRGAIYGVQSNERHRDVEFIHLKGMVIYISSEGVVLSVEPEPRMP